MRRFLRPRLSARARRIVKRELRLIFRYLVLPALATAVAGVYLYLLALVIVIALTE